MASDPPLRVNPWEDSALNVSTPQSPKASLTLFQYIFPDRQEEGANAPTTLGGSESWRQTQDAVIYPGLYSATGFDVMKILLQVMSRPNPQISLGAIDCSVALTLCDLESPDQPIVYASDSFCQLTGYQRSEVLGRNCRFLQNPPPGSRAPSRAAALCNKAAAQNICQAVNDRREIQLNIVNYKRNGQAFTNGLSIIPVSLDDSGFRYALGLQVDLE